MWLPLHLQLGVLLLQAAQPLQQGGGVHPLRGNHLIGEHRLQPGAGPVLLCPQALPRRRAGQACHGAHRPGGGHVYRGEFGPGVEANLVDLLLPVGSVEHLPHPKLASGDFQPGKPLTPLIPGDFKDPGPEVLGPLRFQSIGLDAVQQLLHPLHLEGGAEVHREQLPLHHQSRQFLLGKFLPGQVPLHELLAAQRRALASGLRVCHIHKAVAQPSLQLFEDGGLPLIGLVHLVDKEKDGHPRLLQQLPQGLGVALDPVSGTDHQDGAVQHLQGPLRLGGEVHVSRGVHQGQLQVPPAQDGLFGIDGDAPLPLQLLGVQKGVPVVHPAQAADVARQIEHGLGEGGLPGVHVGHDSSCQSFHVGYSPCVWFSIQSTRFFPLLQGKKLPRALRPGQFLMLGGIRRSSCGR